MARPRDERPEYVVELEVAGIAEVTLRAESASAAAVEAEARCRPAHIVELTHVEAKQSVRPSEHAGGGERAPSPSPRGSVSTGRGHGRQA